MRERAPGPPANEQQPKPEDAGSEGGDARLRAALQRRHIQRKASGQAAGPARVPNGAGSPLGSEVRRRMEPHMGADLSQVRVHTGGDSAQAATDLGARAFTVGNDIHFQSGELAPGTREGDRLLAHELTHVVQGDKSGIHRKEAPGADEKDGEAKGEEATGDVSQPGDPEEKKADAKADQVTDELHSDKPPRIKDDPEWPLLEEKLAQHEGKGDEKGAAPDPLKDGEDDKDDKKVTPEEIDGIGATVSVDRFVGAAKKVQASWDKTKPEERADALAKAANDELVAAQVKPPKPNLEDLGPNYGQFHFRDWIMGLGKTQFSQASVTDDDAANMAETVFHESRHAEQWYLMARMLAGQGNEPAQIHDKTEMQLDACKEAYGNPLNASETKGVEAQGFFESVYGGGADKRDQLLAALGPLRDARQAAEDEYDKVDAKPDATLDDKKAALDKWDAAYHAFKDVHDQYKALPEEKDAWAVGDEVGAAYTAKKK